MGQVELRSYEGSAEELRDFVVRVWRETYGGRMAFPLWTADYLRWQLGIDPGLGHDPHQLLAAYDGARLIGTVLGFPAKYRTPQGERLGSQGSWLSVDHEYRRQGIATRLRQELRRRHAERGLAFQIGYGYFGSPHSLGPSFWQSQRELGTVFLNRVGFWARVLDNRKAIAWNLVGWERWLTQGFGWMVLAPRERSASLRFREYRADDLTACRQLVDRSTAGCELALVWDDASLQRQLSGGGVAQTLLAEKQGQVCGLVNWHCLPFLGRTEERLAVIDLVAWGELGLREQHQLMNAALLRMQNSGAALALKLRIGDHAWAPFVTTGFVPRWPDSYVLATWGQDPPDWPSLRRMHLLWR
jgi:GNAT superfamily N-acetyltransferase